MHWDQQHYEQREHFESCRNPTQRFSGATGSRIQMMQETAYAWAVQETKAQNCICF